jgi:hypothetical protein
MARHRAHEVKPALRNVDLTGGSLARAGLDLRSIGERDVVQDRAVVDQVQLVAAGRIDGQHRRLEAQVEGVNIHGAEHAGLRPLARSWGTWIRRRRSGRIDRGNDGDPRIRRRGREGPGRTRAGTARGKGGGHHDGDCGNGTLHLDHSWSTGGLPALKE